MLPAAALCTHCCVYKQRPLGGYTDMSGPDLSLMHRLAGLRLSPRSETPGVLALSQHFNHLDTMQNHSGPIDVIFANAYSAEVFSKTAFRNCNYDLALNRAGQALQIYTNMRDFATTPGQKTVVESLIGACRELITVFHASHHASMVFQQTVIPRSPEFSLRHYAGEAMDHINNLDCSIEMYNTALQKRSDSMATVQNWGGYLQRPAKDMSIVNQLRVHYGIYPHVEKFDSDRAYVR